MKPRVFVSDIPRLLSEWDWDKNGPLTPESVSFGSNKRVWWRCGGCSYEWSTRAADRCIRKRGCPACAGRVVTNSNRLSVLYPELASEWHLDKNGTLTPERVSVGSRKKVWWLCKNCAHYWCTTVNDRRRNSRGCPACVGKVVTNKNRLSTTYPLVAGAWHLSKNGELAPTDVSYGSHKRVWWECPSCGHAWRAAVKSRCVMKSGCPACGGKVVTDKNRLSLLYPKIAAGWHPTKNGLLTSGDVSFGSKKKAWWVCKHCGNSWRASINNRCLHDSGCPCCSGGSVSGVSQKWLDSLSILQENREVWVFAGGKKYLVDAFVPETNTVFEFLGDYWHGNPNKYCMDALNCHNKKTFGQLFDETAERLQFFRTAGYNLNIIWEKDFLERRKAQVYSAGQPI